ncbi:MAG: DMT family transporter [Proteobacteria bacterium]|nr:DMT family transporter [Pseudomonadota bacterium]
MVETPVLRPLRIFTLATVSVALFAVMNVFVKLATEEHSVVEVMFFRNALAIIPVVMLILMHKKGTSLFLTKRPLAHLVRGTIGTFSMVLFFWSFALLPLADATALHFAMPIILTALSVPILKEVVGPWRWGAVIAGFIGVLVIASPSGDTNWLGTGVALGAACSSAITMMIIRKMGKTEHALTIVFYFSTIGAIISAALLPWFWTPPDLPNFIYLIMTGLTGGAAQVCLTKAYAEAPAAYVSPFNYASILFATLFGWLVWGYIPHMHVLIGSAIVIASGLFILYRETVLKRPISSTDLAEAAPTEADVQDTGQDAAGVRYNPPLESERK